MTINNVIAIDGPSGSGKSTISKILASRLSLIYLDTGAMYRAITWKVLENGTNIEDNKALKMLLENTLLEYHNGKLFMDGKVLGTEIRTTIIDQNVSRISANQTVREYLTDQQIKLGSQNPSVLDGRDIGTTLFPTAILKIFLTANVEVRAKRRYFENSNKHMHDTSLQQIQEQIKRRDEDDSNRLISPLKKADDAIEIDTSYLTVEEVVDKIEKIYKERIKILCTIS